MSDQYNSRTERRKQQKKRAAKPAAAPAKGPKKKKKRSLFKKVFLTFAVLILLSLAGGIGAFAYMVKDAPNLDEALLRDPIPSKVYDKDGKFITTIGSGKLDYVKYEDIPQLVKDAILATEDARFFEHHGVDIIRIGGAALKNVTDGFGSQGASTITQQVVKLSFLKPEKTLKRKAQEAWLAYQLERQYTKEEIFEMYANKVYMSQGIHGIKAAAKHYFNKELDELTLPEAALIAGMPQSPNNYNPFTNPERAEKRRNLVLSLMKQHDKISETEMAQAKAVPLNKLLAENKQGEGETKKYNAYIDMVIEEVQRMGDYNPYSDGLKIYTTLDRKAQDYMDQLLNTEDILSYPSDDFQAGIALTDTKTGEVRAVGGGRGENQKVERGYNYAVDLKQRQPGSVIKPLIDYGPAIEYLNWSTYQQLDDKPTTYPDGTPIRNAGGSYMGPISMRTAMTYSRNIPALEAYKEVGHEKANEFLGNLGIQLKKEESENYSNSIGAMSGISPLDLAGAYAAFGNGGQYNEPHTVKKLILSDGETEVENDIKPKAAMSDYTAYMITDMLRDVVSEGTGTQANIPGLDVAGKTGTTNYTEKEKSDFGIPDSGSPDSWFVGYTTNYTAAIWTGYPNKSEYLSPESQRIAKRLFRYLMEEVSSDVKTEDFKKPKSVVELPILKGSNPAVVAGDSVPDSDKVYELFVKGEEPKKVYRNKDDEEEKDKDKEKEKEEQETKGKIEGLNAAYDSSSQSISVSWSFSGEGTPSFTVTANGQSQAANGNSAVISNVQPGQTYSITVTATVDGATVDSASTSVTASGGENPAEPEDGGQQEPDQPDTEAPDGNNNGNHNGGNTPPPDQGNGQNGGTPPNGDNGGSGNGNNNGNGNGSSSGGNPSPTQPPVGTPPANNNGGNTQQGQSTQSGTESGL
ncbi:PBP1A family penicillin-binding protein [Bacillus xiapuensis]|uniref:PBP1A family penicillin-binding protein n=1 Tax=Bacillus xiapuensis TaxID=2014075 RepID=UPI000C231D64|nr:PBP1A family penicillin-binding protein [Bacillus xiapuensis]